MTPLTDWIIIGSTLLLSSFFSGMEIAFLTANKLRIELEKKQGVLSAKIISRFNENSSFYIGTLLVGNNIALVVYGIYMGKVIINLLYPDASEDSLNATQLLVQTAISTLIILFTAEFLPKSIARINPNRLLQLMWPVLLFFGFILAIPTLITISLSEGLIRIFIGKNRATESHLTFGRVDLDDYIKDIKERAESEDELDHEIQIFDNALAFSDVKARDCMVPRTDIVAFDRDAPIDLLREKMIETGYSKILIYKESIDNIIGYVHSSEMFKKPKEIKTILLPLFIIPETVHASEILKMFIKQRKSVALVVDEFGGTSGIITIEDVIEEILGEIEDEYDIDIFIENKINDNEYDFSARLEIDYLNEKYQLNLPESSEYETLGGLILNLTESIPNQGEEVILDQFRFIISEVEKNRIQTIKIYVNSSQE